MQVSRLSILVLIAFLAGCANTNASREVEESTERAAAILGGSAEIVAAEKTLEETSGEAQAATTRSEVLGTLRCAIAIPCPQDKEIKRGTVIEDLWWTWKYAMWGQGSSKDWPWAW